MQDASPAVDTLEAAAYLADLAAPYLAQARAALRTVWTDKVPLAAADAGWRLYLHPEAFPALPPAQAAFVVLHELAHCVRGHFERSLALGLAQLAANICADCEVNNMEYPDIETLPGCLRAAHFGWPEGQLLEDYAALLQAQGGQAGDASQVSHAPHLSGAADGQPHPWELPQDDPQAPAMTQLVADALREIVAEEIRKLPPGTVAGDWSVWAEQRLPPAVPWQAVLRHALTRGLARIGLTARAAHRVRERGGLYLPRLMRREAYVGIIVDTSGSMTGTPFAQACAEVLAIAKMTGQVDIWWTDVAVHHQRNVRRFEELRAVGGGGTDMGAGIAAVEALRGPSRPDLVVLLTDGYTPWPAVAPRFSCILVHIGGTGQMPIWAKQVIVIPNTP